MRNKILDNGLRGEQVRLIYFILEIGRVGSQDHTVVCLVIDLSLASQFVFVLVVHLVFFQGLSLPQVGRLALIDSASSGSIAEQICKVRRGPSRRMITALLNLWTDNLFPFTVF